MRFRTPQSVCIGRILALAGLVMLAFPGCGRDGDSRGPTVLEIAGKRVCLEDLRDEHDLRSGQGSFDALPLEKKEEFLRTIADKEALLHHVRKSFGGLVPPYDRFLREANEGRLLDALERRLKEPAMRDSAAFEAALVKLNKQMRLSWLVNPSDSLVHVAREQIDAGRPFEEVARQYSKEPADQVELGRGLWRSAEMVTREFVNELFFEDREPGFVTEIHRSPLGFEMFRIEEIRPFDIRGKQSAKVIIPQIVRTYLAERRIASWTDSLKSAHALVIREEALPILTVRMKAYWDSIAAHGASAPKVAAEYEPPVSRFTKEEQKTVLYETGGRGVTIGEFVDQLRAVPMRLWPSGHSIERVREAVETRILIGWKLAIARDLKLDDDPRQHRLADMDEERFLIAQLNEKQIGPSVQVTQEDIEAFYAENKQSYWMDELIRLSYVVFPTKSEAERFYEEARKETGTWWVAEISDFLKNRPDVHTVANSEDFLYAKPLPDSVRAMAELGREAGVTEVLAPVAYPAGGWAVGRVLRRDREGYKPLERMQEGLRKVLTNRRTDAAMQKLIEESKKRYEPKLYPERLVPQEGAKRG